MTVCWNLIKKSQRHLIMHDAWQAWHIVQMMKCTVWLCHHNIFVFLTNRERWLPLQNWCRDHKNCLNLHSSNLLSFHLIQTAACQDTQRTMTPVYDWAKHRAAHSINLWQTEKCCEQSANQWKDCGLKMNQYSELYDMCAEQWQPWQHTQSPICCVHTSEGPAQDERVSVHRSHLQTGLLILSTGL